MLPSHGPQHSICLESLVSLDGKGKTTVKRSTVRLQQAALKADDARLQPDLPAASSSCCKESFVSRGPKHDALAEGACGGHALLAQPRLYACRVEAMLAGQRCHAAALWIALQAY